MCYFRIIMGAFCIIVGVQDVLIGSVAIEASHLSLIRDAYCITSAGHIIISVFNIPSAQFRKIACANYTIISGKRNIMQTYMLESSEAELEPVFIMDHVLGTLGLFIFQSFRYC